LIFEQHQIFDYVTVRPQVSLVRTAILLAIQYLDSGFIGLEIMTGQYLSPLVFV